MRITMATLGLIVHIDVLPWARNWFLAFGLCIPCQPPSAKKPFCGEKNYTIGCRQNPWHRCSVAVAVAVAAVVAVAVAVAVAVVVVVVVAVVVVVVGVGAMGVHYNHYMFKFISWPAAAPGGTSTFGDFGKSLSRRTFTRGRVRKKPEGSPWLLLPTVSIQWWILIQTGNQKWTIMSESLLF